MAYTPLNARRKTSRLVLNVGNMVMSKPARRAAWSRRQHRDRRAAGTYQPETAQHTQPQYALCSIYIYSSQHVPGPFVCSGRRGA